MELFSRNEQPLQIINGETKYVTVDEVPEHCLLLPSVEMVKMGFRCELCGPNTVALENTHSVIRTLKSNTLMGVVYQLKPYAPPKAKPARAA